MPKIYQFNSTDGRNQIYVDDLKRISDATADAFRSLPWTTPVAIANAKLGGSGLEITPSTFVVVNGIVFGCDITATVPASQYLYAVCEYDTTQPRNKAEGGTYQQAVVRYLKVSSSKLSDTDPSNAPVFPGIGEYLIYGPGASTKVSFKSDGTIIPFDLSLVIPSGGISSEYIGPLAVQTEDIANRAVTTVKLADNSVSRSKLDNSLDLETKYSGGPLSNQQAFRLPGIYTFNIGSTTVNSELYVAASGLHELGDYRLHGTVIITNPNTSVKNVVFKYQSSGGRRIAEVAIPQNSTYCVDLWVSNKTQNVSIYEVKTALITYPSFIN